VRQVARSLDQSRADAACHRYGWQVPLCVLASHYPKPEHQAEMIERIGRAVEVLATCPGFVAADCWVEEDGDAVVAIGVFDSKTQWLDAMRVVAAADIDFDFDERERAPRQVRLLVKA
jgi:Antibiotic biosynthesis monooxygenase